MKTFEQFINEKWDTDIITTKIKNKTYDFKVKDLYDFIKNNNYKIVDLDVKKISKFGLCNDVENLLVKDESSDKWIKYKDLPKERQIEMKQKDDRRIEKSKLDYPIIVSINDKKEYAILDGNHRLRKADNLNKEKIKAYVIPEKEILNAIKDKKILSLD